MASFDTYFSVLALFILFRETIEASIICGVLLQFLNRAKPVLKRTGKEQAASRVQNLHTTAFRASELCFLLSWSTVYQNY